MNRHNPFGGTPLVLQGTRTSHLGALAAAEGSIRVGPEGVVYPLPPNGNPQTRPASEPIVLVDARPDAGQVEEMADEAVRQAVQQEMRGPKKLIKFGIFALVAYGLARATGLVR